MKRTSIRIEKNDKNLLFIKILSDRQTDMMRMKIAKRIIILRVA